MRSALHAHALVIAAIFVPYFGSMAVLFGYMMHQVHHHERKPEDDIRQDLDAPAQMVIALGEAA